MRAVLILIAGVTVMAWHDDMQTMSAAIDNTRRGGAQEQPFGSSKPKMPTATEEINQLLDELMAKVKRGEMTVDQARSRIAPLQGPKNEITGYYTPTPSSGQIDLRPPYDPYEIRKTMQQQGWGVR
jgi:uncharacterized protein YukE